MRKLILLEHITLDGFAGGPKGELDWIKFDDEMFADVGSITKDADTALYGRVTFQIMESYWPTAAEQPGATKHDIEHSNWVNKALKIVFSRTLKGSSWSNTRIIHENAVQELQKLKEQPGKNLLMIGSPGTAKYLMTAGLIDDYRLYLNPMVLGKGISLFDKNFEKINLSLVDIKSYRCGVAGLHYQLAN